MNQSKSLSPALFIPPRPPSGLRFRLATRKDSRPLYQAFFVHQTVTDFRSKFERVLERQRNGRSYWLVAESGINIVGSGQLVIYPHGAELANLIVLTDYQNQGIGTAMIQVLTAIAQWVGLTSLEIGVTASNELARALYQRLDFKEDRQLQFADDEPAIILRKELKH